MDGFLRFVFDLIVVILRVLIPLTAIVILYKIYSSLRHNRRNERPLIMLYDENEGRAVPVLYWENSIGRSRRCDIYINDPAVSREHAVLLRRDNGWIITDVESKTGVFVNGERAVGRTNVYLDDRLRMGSTELVLKRADEFVGKTRRSWFFSADGKNGVSQKCLLIRITLFQLFLGISACLTDDCLSSPSGEIPLEPLGIAVILSLTMWAVYTVTSLLLKRVNFEIEALAFFLSSIGIMLTAHQPLSRTIVQYAAMCLGLILFEFLIFFLSDADRVQRYSKYIYFISLGLFAVNLVFGRNVNGAANWISLGPVTFQPSEIVKVGFIMVGAATLDQLQKKKNLFIFLVFSAICVGALALMSDFGTALIFFATFLIISFMRSGDFRTLILAVSSAVFASTLMISMKPYILQRFSSWGHIFDQEFIYGDGNQQARMLINCASGGLFGVGLGNGHCLKDNLFAADSDAVVGVLCEELGLLLTITIAIGIGVLVFYARAISTRSRSTFYSISASCAAGLLVIQLSLNFFGATDILPFTGVTFPFISAGGSSMMSCWALFAFLKAADERTYAIKKAGLFKTEEV